jgi:hypothetical protein
VFARPNLTELIFNLWLYISDKTRLCETTFMPDKDKISRDLVQHQHVALYC